MTLYLIIRYTMITNHKDIYKIVAEKYNLDQKLVEKVGNYTWKDLNKRVAGFDNREIYMFKLGVFKFRKLKGEQYLLFLRGQINKIRNNIRLTDEQKENLIKFTQNNIRKIEVLVNQWEDILEQKKQFKSEQTTRNI